MFWVYENYSSNRSVVHDARCFHCKDGKGKIGRVNPETGRWHGRFATREEAERFARTTNRRTQVCGNCLGEWAGMFHRYGQRLSR